MAFIEVFPYDEPAEDNNPYSAKVGYDLGTGHGYVQIVPPFEATPILYGQIKDDVGVKLSPHLNTAAVTTLKFEVLPDTTWNQALTDEERIITTVQHLLNELGIFASNEAFKQHWAE